MRRIFLVAAVLALAARAAVFTEPGTNEALASFIVFWVCAGGYVASSITG